MNQHELRSARKALGLTQAGLAEKIGLKQQSHVSMMETGRRPISDRTVLMVDALVKGRERPAREV